jgi:hypothetical protein
VIGEIEKSKLELTVRTVRKGECNGGCRERGEGVIGNFEVGHWSVRYCCAKTRSWLVLAPAPAGTEWPRLTLSA